MTLEEAITELQHTTLQKIQHDTALTWCARACAARILSKEAAKQGHNAAAFAMWQDACEYEHEALEHAALADESAVLLLHIRETLAVYT
jgi:hypothetical protein